MITLAAEEVSHLLQVMIVPEVSICPKALEFLRDLAFVLQW